MLRESVFDIIGEDSGYQIIKDGELIHTAPDCANLIYDLLGIIHAHALEAFWGYIRIHSGCGYYDGRRFLLIGDKGVGKSTLMMRLLFDGFRVEGDELVLVKNEDVTPFPRRFHLKSGSIGLLPEFKFMIEAVPYIELYNGSVLYSFSPRDAGYDWKIESREAEVIFYLEANHGGETSIEKCPKYLMAKEVMARSFLSESHDHLKIGTLCSIVGRADCYVLRVGNLASAAASIRRLLTGSVRPGTARGA